MIDHHGAGKKTRSLFEELDEIFSSASLESRGENAWGVAVKFIKLLEKHVDDDVERKKLMSAWFKSVRDDDFKKFRRALNRYKRGLNTENFTF